MLKGLFSDELKIDSLKDVLEYEGFKISFAIAIITLGVISLFYNTSNTILIGISISSFIFSIIDTFWNRKTLFYVFPLTILLIFCIYPNFFIVKYLSDPKLNNLIVFVSFGATFITNAYSNYLSRYKSKKIMYDGLVDSVTLVGNQFENIQFLTEEFKKIKIRFKEIGLKDEESNKLLDNLVEYLLNEYNISKVRYDLSLIGQDKGKSSFSLDEIEEILKENSVYEFKQKVYQKIKEKKMKKS